MRVLSGVIECNLSWNPHFPTTNNAPTRSFKVKYKLADLFNFCSEYRKALYKIPIRVTLTRRFDDEVNQFLFHSADEDANAFGRAWLKDIVLRIPTHELNTEPSVKFLSQYNGNRNRYIIQFHFYV